MPGTVKESCNAGVSKKHTLCKKEVAHEALLFGPYGSGIYGDDVGGNGCPGFGAAGRVRVGLFRRRLVCSVLLVTGMGMVDRRVVESMVVASSQRP